MLNHEDTVDFYDLVMDSENFEPMTLRSRGIGNAQNTFTNYSLPRVRRKSLTKSADVGSSGKMAALWDDFQVWQDSLDQASPTGSPPPKNSDVFLDGSGNQWVVKNVVNTLCAAGGTGNVWNCRVLLAIQ